jgi:glutaconate CoA-transferase subunit A
MRAASHGLPFEPLVGLAGSDIPAVAGLKTVRDPYTGAELYAVPAIRPAWAILHVQEADALGNARIYGSPYWDVVMSRAAARAILTVERIVSAEELARQPELTRIPHFLVAAVVHAPEGARPTSCHPFYGIDEAGVGAYLEAAGRPETLRSYLEAADAVLRRVGPRTSAPSEA